MQYALLIYSAEPEPRPRPRTMAAEMAGYDAFTEHLRDAGAMQGRRGAPSDRDRDDRPRPRRPDAHDRRAVRRDEGGARRLLPRRGRRPRRGDRLRGDDPGREERLHRGPARSVDYVTRRRTGAARPGTDARTDAAPLTGSDAAHEIVDRLFREEQGRAVATLIRVTRRLRPRRGGRPGRVHQRARDAGRSGACPTTRAPGSRRPRATGRSTGCAGAERLVEKTEVAGSRGGDGGGARRRIDPGERRTPMPIADDRLRLIFTCCHPALAMDARVALTLRTLGGLTTPEIARAFLVPEPTLAQRLVRAKRKIRDAGHPLPGAARRAAARAARWRPAGALPRLQRGLRGIVGRRADPARAVRRGHPAGTGRRVAAPRRARGARAPRADAPPRRAARGAGRTRPASSCCSTTRTGRAGTAPGSPRARRSSSARWRTRRPGPVPAPGRDRGPPRRGADRRRHRLAADRRRSTGRSSG